MKKLDAIIQSIREAKVGDNVVIHNEQGMIWCIIKVLVKEHDE